MPAEDVYENYFDIDPDYKPVMTEDLINAEKDAWKNFYPHEKFIDLLETTATTLRHNGSGKRAIWVTGSYGTGKSHAVLTLKKMLDADSEDVKEYFNNNDILSDKQLLTDILKIKEKNIVTVYHYGSSNIRSTAELGYHIQNAIKKELISRGYDVSTTFSLKDRILDTLKNDKAVANFIYSRITDRYSNLFSLYPTINDIIHALENGTNAQQIDVIKNIVQLYDNEESLRLPLSADDLLKWIEDVIRINNIDSIFFIWDEFTEFFNNNNRNLTDFQRIIDPQSHLPFILTIVTHIAGNQLGVADEKKLKDRFHPLIEITLPDNMAFRLMAKALKIKQGKEKKWNDYKEFLWRDVRGTGQQIVSFSQNRSQIITEEDLKGILPFHPYAALILKYISTIFNSNQRSMFEYIKESSAPSTVANFKAYIHECGPTHNQYLTCDRIWDYFFGGNNPKLGKELDEILYVYRKASENKSLCTNDIVILKTILLLNGLRTQALHVQILRPTIANLQSALEGTDINKITLTNSIHVLESQSLISPSPIGNGDNEYLCMGGNTDKVAITSIKQNLKDTLKTIDILQRGKISEKFSFKNYDALNLRYKHFGNYADSSTWQKISTELSNSSSPSQIPVMFTFGKDNAECLKLTEIIDSNKLFERNPNLLIVDCTAVPLTDKEYDEILEDWATEKYWLNKNDQQRAAQYHNSVENRVVTWIDKIISTNIALISKEQGRIQFPGWNQVLQGLDNINKRKFPLGIEYLCQKAPVYKTSFTKKSVEFGVLKKPSNIFSSITTDKDLMNILNDSRYWENAPDHLLSRIKIRVDELISSKFLSDGKIQFDAIWKLVSDEPFGFMPIDLSAFILGFLLKEYVNDEYTWSNNSTAAPMDIGKLQEMIEAEIKGTKEKTQHYLVQLTEEEKQFIRSSEVVFNLERNSCASIEKTRNAVAQAINNLSYPLWALKYYVDKTSGIPYTSEIKEIISIYCELPRNQKNSADIKQKIKRVGSLFISINGLDLQVREIFTSRNTLVGMENYVNAKYPNIIKNTAILGLDRSAYLTLIKSKFSHDSTWLWEDSEIEKIIDKVALEYEVCVLSSKYLSATSYTTLTNGWKNLIQEIRIPAEVLKEYKPEYSALLDILRENFSISSLPSLECIKSIVDKSPKYLDDILAIDVQRAVFIQYCKKNFKEIADDTELSFKIYDELQPGQFFKTNQQFADQLHQEISNLCCIRLAQQLDSKWVSLVGNDKPRVWSEKHQVPLLIFFNNDKTFARKCLDVINYGSTNEKELTDALSFLSNPVFKKINDSEYINSEFISKILKDYALLIDTSKLDAVKEILKNKMDVAVYDWLDNSEQLQTIIMEYVNKEYSNSGYKSVCNLVDQMSAEESKEYLKKLVHSVSVGLEIIKKENLKR